MKKSLYSFLIIKDLLRKIKKLINLMKMFYHWEEKHLMLIERLNFQSSRGLEQILHLLPKFWSHLDSVIPLEDWH